MRIDDAVIAELTRLIPLAPLHQPHHLAAIAALSKLHPTLPQVACFDTSFHHTQPAVATPSRCRARSPTKGVRRYGFHGLSYEYIASVLPDVDRRGSGRGRVVVAHLGSGASMCAMQQRKSVATTMGFTALDGLPMGRRCGSLDPGVVLYLMEQKRMTAAAVSDLLYQFVGTARRFRHQRRHADVAGERQSRTRPRPSNCSSIASAASWDRLPPRSAGSMRLVFTAGIGEHAAEIRRRVCEQAAWLGFELDEAANAAGGPRLTQPAAAPPPG